MSETPPEVPGQPPMTVPMVRYEPPPGQAGPHEPPVGPPPLGPPVEAYRLVAYQLPPARAAHPVRTALVAVVALVCAGGVAAVILALAADDDPPSASSPAVAAAAPAPPVAATLDLSWPELSAEPESAEPELRSSQTGAPTVVHFENLSGETVTLSWLDYGNTPVRYSDLADRQGYDQETYSGHIWVVTRTDGSTEMYAASSAPARVVIR